MSWDDIYRNSELSGIPWEAGKPDRDLVKTVKGRKPGRAMDICCGTGNDSIFLAQKGWIVSAIDISETAIAMAKRKAQDNKLRIDFQIGSVLNLPFPRKSFDFVNDRGCFHHMIHSDKDIFLEELLRVLRSEGTYNMKCFSVKEKSMPGPHRFRKDEIRSIFSSYFTIKKIADSFFEGPVKPRAYHCVMVRK